MDFDQNVRPPPVTTVEDTASLEELIMKRITEVCQHPCCILLVIGCHALETVFIYCL